MKKSTKALWLVAALAMAMMPCALEAQGEDGQERWVYATYYQCNPADEWMADGIASLVIKPVYDEAVEDGTLLGWSWLAHHTGGTWRRVLVRATSTLEGAFDALETLAEKTQKANPSASGKLGEICSSRVDYIWQMKARATSEADLLENPGK